ncbi:DUF805 domain-containing protein [Lacticaseibacillus zhaodongensis]|uniref:DUF805 domain-containing protein n=1 Tax=Lacticaseibacillus zhaodongensis TaxID=2668065 RepID=UPI0018AFCCE9|nr:DUF805 domain-containing protein [Lacticaseibacillus zhaodongensis]
MKERKVGFLLAPVVYVRRAFDFRGKSRRPEYWWLVAWGFILITVVMLLPAGLQNSLLRYAHPVPLLFHGNLLAIVAIIVQVFFYIASLSLSTRRIRDAGWNPYWVLLSVGTDVLGLLPTNLGILSSAVNLATFATGLFLLYVCIKPSAEDHIGENWHQPVSKDSAQ